jgi:DNA-binding transcriptional regulator YhcF (GntR family)
MVTDVVKVEQSSAVPKYEQIIVSITDAIGNKKLRRGDKLPSLNQVSKRYKVSLNTVVKAYDDLKKQGIIDSANGKGFHVASESVKITLRVFLLFDELNLFKQDLYNSFKQALGENCKIDIFFHHYNFEIYESLILDHIGKYGMYVIMPTPDLEAAKVLERLNPDQVLILDQKHHVSDEYSSIVQDFEQETYSSLKEGLARITRYSSVSLVHPSTISHPELLIFAEKISIGISRFCSDFSMPYHVRNQFDFNTIEAGNIYFVIPDDDLVELIKSAKRRNLKIGEDIGIISFNDNTLKEVIEGGITTISTDFNFMGREAARFIMEKRKANQVSPASLIVRNSL